MKRHLHWLAIAFVFLFFSGINAYSQSRATANSRYKNAIAASRDAVRAMMKNSKVPGVSVAVAMKGEIVWNEGFGFVDLDKKVNATVETKFGVGSITKSFTAALFARLMEEGKVDFDAPVENYLPQFPHKQKGVTARLIIGHLSGLNDEFNTTHYYETRHFTTSAAVQEILQTNKLQYPPRTRHEYTTSNYTIIAAIIEKASGQDFSAAMQQYVIKPLGLKNTLLNDRTLNLEHCTSFYVQNEKDVIKAPDYDPSFKWAGAGLLATAADVATYGVALLQSKFLKPSTRDAIFRALKTSSSEDTGYGLGWYIAQDTKGRRMYHHGGGGLGISSYLRLYTQEDFVLAILSNLTNAPVNGEVATTIAEAFLSAK
ncbi:MAG: serine hydrolase domain-containing protein [bacterium]